MVVYQCVDGDDLSKNRSLCRASDTSLDIERVSWGSKRSLKMRSQIPRSWRKRAGVVASK